MPSSRIKTTGHWAVLLIVLVTVSLLIFLTACSGENQAPTSSIEETRKVVLTEVAATFFRSTEIPTLTITNPPMVLVADEGETPSVVISKTVASIVPSKTSTPTPKPTRTKKPTFTKVPSKTPTSTRIPPTPIPQDAPIRIYVPASNSIITSPLQLAAGVVPGSGGNVYLRLTGEKGQTILEKSWVFAYANGKRTTIDEQFPFKIAGLSEAARLTIFTRDSYGRTIALSSEDVLLISIGETDLAEAQNLMSAFTIRSPYPESSIHHGLVEVRGITKTRSTCAVYFELVDVDGKVVGSYTSPDVVQPSLEYQDVKIDVPYKVSKGTSIRLIMHQIDVKNGMDLAVSSLLLRVYP